MVDCRSLRDGMRSTKSIHWARSAAGFFCVVVLVAACESGGDESVNAPSEAVDTTASPTVATSTPATTSMSSAAEQVHAVFDPLLALTQGWEQVSLDEFYDLRLVNAPDVAVSDAGVVAVFSGGIVFDGGMPDSETVTLYSPP